MSFGQGGPDWGSGGSSTPDWTALAEQAERTRARRRRWMMAGGGALATAAVAGIVAVAVVNEGGGDASDKPSSSLPPPEDLPSSSAAEPDPTFKDEPPPPPPPKDFIADAQHDKAPLSITTLFPGKRVTVNGRPYKLADTSTSKKCADAAHAGLAPVLDRNKCETLYRATFTRDGLAVTVGIAVFQKTEPATRVKREYKPNLVALPGKGVPHFCRTVVCRTTANSLGRYAYFTIAGRTNGKESGPADKQAERAALDGSNYAYARILQRGRAQSSEAAEAPQD
ncbi:hypothetical protein [Streptomyces iconiensis]|uniref:Tat pathway signal sequence domain protein n=1 Tax=Streptomyces iconiensis TaxID=1384038 RepID=A0ABT7A8I8_9ACTN|nr:hypothetical protein [Streptomyces iconiensis]MDJ1137662.1 hypothetical protein [Streptomyces iconiensis]